MSYNLLEITHYSVASLYISGNVLHAVVARLTVCISISSYSTLFSSGPYYAKKTNLKGTEEDYCT